MSEGSEAGDSDLRLNFRELVLKSHADNSAVENTKPWVAQRTIHSWQLGGPSQFWLVRQSAVTVKSINSNWYLYFWMVSSKCCSQTIWIYAIGLMASMTCDKHGPYHGKNNKISLPLQHWGLCLPQGHMIPMHLWNCLSAFIMKSLIQNLDNSLVAKRTGPSMVRHLAPGWPRFSSFVHTNYASMSVC